METISYRIPITGLKQSTNKIYAGQHWAKRKDFADDVLNLAAGVCRPVKVIDAYPVEIRYRFLFSSRALDTTNCTYMVKVLEDALRAIGILEDDDPSYVARTIIESVQLPKQKKPKGAAAQGSQGDQQKEDWVEITINATNQIHVS